MKATELMIGNWVKIKGDYGKPLKITTIDDTYNSINYFDGDAEGELALRLNDIEPIPLTPEILKKNGFVHYDLTDFWMWKKESVEPVHLDKYDKDGWRLRINCDKIPCECKYVHQLQHALRLCGIEKEIIL